MDTTARGIEIPLTPQEAGVILTALAVAALSTLVYWILRQAAPSARNEDRRTLGALDTFAILLAPIWLLLIALVVYNLWRLTEDFGTNLTPEDLRWHVLAFVGLITALGALVSAPLALIRVYTTERQTRVAEQSHVTDQINKAVAGLGAEKAVKRRMTDAAGEPLSDINGKPSFEEITVPNIEVRVGAIYALERIAQDSMKYDKGRDHVQIMEILCAYVRENAPAKSLEPTEPPFPRRTPRIDIQAVVDVLGRRSVQQMTLERARRFRLDLRNSDLSFVSFRKTDFSAAIFHRCRLEASDFSDAKLHGTRFIGALLNFASFFRAELVGTRFDLSVVNRPTPTVGGWVSSINMGELFGVSLSGADISAIPYMGKPEEMNMTFGTRDTKLHSDVEEGRRGLREKEIAVFRAKRGGNREEIRSAEEAFEATGFANWCDFDSTDMALGHMHGRFLVKLGLTGWPYEEN